MPLRGLIGSDILKHRADWKVRENPFADNDPIVHLPALRPDVTLMHAPLADKYGNVWVGVRRELMLMAHASTETFVTAEEITQTNLMDDKKTKAGTIPGLYITALAEAKSGAWPIGIPGGYDADHDHLSQYVNMAKTPEGFQKYLKEFVFERKRVAAE